MPYPWRELKLSEFPGLAGYAQGFGTNITFSENIGFLTKNDAKTDATFLVTAHEAAHQWWGNILTPANGPERRFPERRHGALLDDAALRAGQGTARAHGVREGNRGALRRPPARRRRAPDVRRRRQARRRQHRDLRPRRLGVLDGLRLSRARARPGRVPQLLPDLEPEPRPPGAAGLRRRDATVRGRPGGLRRVRQAMVRGQGGAASTVLSKREQGGERRRLRRHVHGREHAAPGRMPVEVAATSGERWKRADGQVLRTRRTPTTGKPAAR